MMTKDCSNQTLIMSSITTKLGEMITISDNSGLHLLEFVTSKGLKQLMHKLKNKKKINIISGSNDIIKSIIDELQSYFAGTLREFKTPIHLQGTSFQKEVWQSLMLIPYGSTLTYKHQAETLGKPTSYRAVANANGMNRFAIIIPCHRIINSNGSSGGYRGGVKVKEWLLNHETKCLMHQKLEAGR